MPRHLTSFSGKNITILKCLFKAAWPESAWNRKTIGLKLREASELLNSNFLFPPLPPLRGASSPSWCPPWRGSRGPWTRWCDTSPCSCPSHGAVCSREYKSVVVGRPSLALAFVPSSLRLEVASELVDLSLSLVARPSVVSWKQREVDSSSETWSPLAPAVLTSTVSLPCSPRWSSVNSGLVLGPAGSWLLRVEVSEQAAE